jgi:hypothetical protein
MIKKYVTLVMLILCLCLLPSCTSANPALGDADIPEPGGIAKLSDNTGLQLDDSDQVQPSERENIKSNENPPDSSKNDDDSAAVEINAVDGIRSALRKDDSPKVNDELIKSFFYYQRESHGYNGPYHWYELRALPDFGNGADLDWDGLLLFAFSLFQQERDAEGYSYMPKGKFEKAVDRLFYDLEYTHKSSSLFDFTGDRYTATGWDYHGGVYYRLREISRNSDGTFAVVFDGFSFHELDTFEERYDYISENMKALFDYAGERKTEVRKDDLVLEIFLKDNYAEIMHADERVDITFGLSDDPEFAFRYLSCNRERLNE